MSAREALDDWGFYEKQINRVLRRVNSGHDPEDVISCIQMGNMQLWRAVNGSAICVTELQTYPRYRQLLLFMVAGADAESWLATGQRQLEAFALQNGCDFMVFQGRPGWERLAAPYGYGHKQVFLRKDLSHGRREHPSDDDDDI